MKKSIKLTGISECLKHQNAIKIHFLEIKKHISLLNKAINKVKIIQS